MTYVITEVKIASSKKYLDEHRQVKLKSYSSYKIFLYSQGKEKIPNNIKYATDS